MIRQTVAALFSLLSFLPFFHTGDQPVRWTCLTVNASFPKSYNYQMFSIRDTLWVMHPEGSYYSIDGKQWKLSPLKNIIKNNAFLDYILFNGVLYGLGTFDGNIERNRQTTAIHSSSDMRTWKQLSGKSNLPKRFFYHPFVFKEKIWIIGGSDGRTEYADVWNSSDAVHWNKIADDLPFGKRSSSQFVLFNERMYMLGKDVWSSADGVRWRKEIDHIVPEDLFGYTAVVYDDAIWLLGCNRNQVFTSEVLVSRDGRTWSPQRTPWSPRGGVAASVYKNGIIMTGGKYGGFADGQTEFVYSNDVWIMEKK